MYIVKRPELMNMLKEKNNVVYSEVNEYSIDGLYIGKYLGEHDFMTKDLLDNIKINDRNEMFWQELDKMKQDPNYKSEIDFERESRDGIFDDEQEYLIYETKDIERLIENLKSVYLY